MAYFATIIKPSGVRHACRANFLSEHENSLIIAKSNVIEVYNFETTGLALKESFTIFGRITALLTIRPATSSTDHLFIATDRYDYFTCSWDANGRSVKNQQLVVDASDRFLRDTKAGPLYLADPEGKLLALHFYQGTFLSIPIIQQPRYARKGPSGAAMVGRLEESSPVRFEEPEVVDMVFLYGMSTPVVAMLYRDNSKNDHMHLRTYEVLQQGRAFKKWDVEDHDLEADANILIPIPQPLGGVLVLGDQMVTYIYPSPRVRPYRQPRFEPTLFTAWAMLTPKQYILGDDHGKLYILELGCVGGAIKHVNVEKIGDVNTPTKLISLEDNHVYVGSHQGDSQLVKLNLDGKRSLEVIQSYTNLAPVMDFQVLGSNESGPEDQQHRYASGQLKIVSGNGGYSGGTLRSLRSGVGLENLGILGEMTGIRGLWAIKTRPCSEFDDMLVISFIHETRILSFEPSGEVEELDSFSGFIQAETTLCCANVVGGQLLQVTPSEARLIDPGSGRVLWQMVPERRKITMASANIDTLVAVIGGTTVGVYDIRKGLKEIGRRVFDYEVACITIPQAPSRICTIGFWTTSTIAVLTVPDLRTITKEHLAGENGVAVPRAVLLVRLLEGSPSLLVAMGDGTLYTFSVNEADCSLSQKKTIALGTQAVLLQALPRNDGLVNVFATCDHPSLIYGSEGRIVYSAITGEKSTHVVPFNAEAFPGSVVLSTEDDLRIVLVDSGRTTHVQTLKIGNIVRRVTYSKENRVFGIVTIQLHVEEETGDEKFKSFFRIVDEVLLDFLDTFELGEAELVESLLCTKLDNGDGTLGDKFVVGTGFHDDHNDEPKRGRILVFEVTTERKVKQTAELGTEAAVKCLAKVGDKIVATVNKTIQLYSYCYLHSSRPQLIKKHIFRTHNEAIDLSVSGDLIALGDLMKGPALLRYVGGSNGDDRIEDVARIYNTSWTTSVEMWDSDAFVATDVEGNMAIYKWNKNGVTEEDRNRLEFWGGVRIGEMVNRVRRVEEVALLDDVVIPKAYFATTEGSIYLLGKIKDEKLDLLMKLQQNLSKVLEGVGGINFNTFRAFNSRSKMSDEPYRFVDGDFIEKFLQLPDHRAQEVVDGVGKAVDSLGVDIEEVRSLIENLKRVH